MTKTSTLAFEIGTEEIPAFDLERATVQLERLVPSALDSQNIPHGKVKIYSTPRRLIAVVEAVATQTQAREELFRGPAARIAYDEQGNPTKAAIGFARGKGIDVDQLQRRDENGTEYVFALRSTPARSVAAMLPDVLRGVIDAISWPKSMRWGSGRDVFTRPVRWLVAMLGTDVVPVKFASICASNLTYGHRFLAPGPHVVPSADALMDVVESAYVVSSEKAREAVIRNGVAAVEQDTGFHAELPAKTLTEVINLSEYPTVMMGTFDEVFLQVPEEIIVDAMLMHQRYFPLYDDNGKLMNKFVIVSNGDPAHEATIVDGNQRVVAARLYDAKFFYEEDLKRPLEAYVERLDEVVFQENLGTMRAKTDRVVRLAGFLAQRLQMSEEETADVSRAAYLAKADLVTNAVIEFTSVQGIMGSHYATAAGENERVAGAIADHYRPRFSGDEPPATKVGRVVATSDKLDTVCGLFAVDQAPTGSSDPFALRRAALGILTMMQGEDGLDFSLVDAIGESLRILADGEISFEVQRVSAEIVDFFIARMRVILRDGGAGADAIDAVLAAGVQEPIELSRRVLALEAARKHEPEEFADLATAFARANNLRDAHAGSDFDENLSTPVERELAHVVDEAHAKISALLDQDDYAGALTQLAALRTPIDAFFDSTKVMDDDMAIRTNRMKLLNRFVGVFAHIADFGLMAKAK